MTRDTGLAHFLITNRVSGQKVAILTRWSAVEPGNRGLAKFFRYIEGSFHRKPQLNEFLGQKNQNVPYIEGIGNN